MPFIKSEPEEFGNNPNRYTQAQNYGHNQQNFNQYHNQDGGSIDPSELTMSNGNFNQYGFGSQNMSSSFSMGNSAFNEDELLDSLDMNNNQPMMDDFSNTQQFTNQPQQRGSVP
ncbi:MAG: hypothetical protein M1823_007703, partial [Watsoniomyces obsoletus]